MKRVLAFVQALGHEITAAVTPDEKRAICETAKQVVAHLMTGFWAAMATAAINDVEKTIK